MSDEKPISAHYSKSLGQYNWAGSNKEWMVGLHTSFGTVSQTWDHDDEPETDDLLPSEVLDLIEARLDSYWISTNREKDKAKIAAIREHADEIDRAWLSRKVESARIKLASYERRLSAIEETESV